MHHHEIAVKDLMSSATVTARADEAVDVVLREMALADIRHVPIVDLDDHLVGIVSQRDLQRALAGTDDRATIVGSVMKSRVWTIPPDAPAAEAAEVLIAHKIGCLPVVNADGRLVGIVTDSDLLALARELL